MTPLRWARLNAGYTQVDLAHALGIHPSNISKVELRARRSWPRLRREAALVLGIPEAVLFPGGE